ncbi:hypothetical protein Stsp01_65130 [Streptomyces sp. NBRC 13847]|nr:hypothetical protein Stsp01_65130 [Streptomyces sp. NBRC 13847]
MRDDQAGTSVAAICDDRGAARRAPRAGQLPSLAVVAVAGQRPADGDGEPGGVVAGGDEGAVHDQHSVLAEPLALLERESRCEVFDDAVGARLDTPNSEASWRRVEFVRQYAATRNTRSSSGRLHGRPLRTGAPPSRRRAVINWRTDAGSPR